MDCLSAEVVERRVKEEIRIREMAWRRKVEVEIRREIIMEQELAILRAAERTLDDEQFSMKSSGQRMLNQSNSSPLRFLEPPKEATNDEEKDKPILLVSPIHISTTLQFLSLVLMVKIKSSLRSDFNVIKIIFKN